MMALVHTRDIGLSHVREGVRKAVPEVASQLARAVVELLPEQIIEEMVLKVCAALETGVMARVVDRVRAQGPGDAGGDEGDAGTPQPPTRPLNEPVVVLWASEINAYLGGSKWDSVEKYLGKVWERSHGTSYRAARDLWLERGRKPRRYTSSEAVKGFTQPDSDVLPQRGGDAGTLAVQTQEEMQSFLEKATAKQTLQLYSAMGKAGEDVSADLLAVQLKQPVVARNSAWMWRSDTPMITPVDRVMHCRPPGAIVDPGLFTITGEVDGWLQEPPYQDVVVEFKTRMKAIPEEVLVRDLYQIQTYLAMHGVEEGLLVQRLFSDTSTIRVTKVVRDEALWTETILPGLQQFVRGVRRLMRGGLEDEKLRHEVFSACEPAEPLHPLNATAAQALVQHAMPKRVSLPTSPRRATVSLHGGVEGDADGGTDPPALPVPRIPTTGEVPRLPPPQSGKGPTPPKTMPYRMFKTPARPPSQPTRCLTTVSPPSTKHFNVGVGGVAAAVAVLANPVVSALGLGPSGEPSGEPSVAPSGKPSRTSKKRDRERDDLDDGNGTESDPDYASGDSGSEDSIDKEYVPCANGKDDLVTSSDSDSEDQDSGDVTRSRTGTDTDTDTESETETETKKPTRGSLRRRHPVKIKIGMESIPRIQRMTQRAKSAPSKATPKSRSTARARPLRQSVSRPVTRSTSAKPQTRGASRQTVRTPARTSKRQRC